MVSGVKSYTPAPEVEAKWIVRVNGKIIGHFSKCCLVGLNDISLLHLYLDMNIQDIHIEKAMI